MMNIQYEGNPYALTLRDFVDRLAELAGDLEEFARMEGDVIPAYNELCDALDTLNEKLDEDERIGRTWERL